MTDDGEEVVDGLMKELKKLEDKQMLTEPHLTLARISHSSLQNIPEWQPCLPCCPPLAVNCSSALVT